MTKSSRDAGLSAGAVAAPARRDQSFDHFRLLMAGVGFAAVLGSAGPAVAQAGPPPPEMPAPPAEMPAPMPMMSPVSTPAMAGPLSANPMPFNVDLGPTIGKIYGGGAISGLAFWQDHALEFGADSKSRGDLDNGQLFIQKVDGPIQFFVQGGIYSLPALGAPYFLNSNQTTEHTYGWVPVAFLKIAPTDTFSITAGKLPTLVGDEYTFTYENMNIFRGLLWNQEPAISRGVQANYTAGPLAFALSLNDGYYSNRYNWVSGSVAWTIDMENSISFIGAGNLGHTGYATVATPFFQNNGSIFNVIYTHTDGPLVISPYVQFSNVDASAQLGILHSASTTGVALLASYAFNDFIKLAGRVEYIDASGKGTTLGQSTNLLYGPGSNAFSFTITPTFQYELFYARAEWSIVDAGSTVPGFVFGPNGRSTSQNRFAIEGGVLF